jgi:hypothetical protein
MADIAAPDLLAVLRRVEAAGNSESAHRLRSLYGRVARFAIGRGLRKPGVRHPLGKLSARRDGFSPGCVTSQRVQLSTPNPWRQIGQ